MPRQGVLPQQCALRHGSEVARASTTRSCSTCSATSREAGTSNLFMVKDGVVKTPALNGTFLAGITRRRTIELLRGAGVQVEETTLTVADFMDADEIFSTGNNSKVVPINRIETREMQPGPMMLKARKLYWDWAHSEG